MNDSEFRNGGWHSDTSEEILRRIELLALRLRNGQVSDDPAAMEIGREILREVRELQ